MKDRLGVLDGLRGIAVLQVLWYHVWQVGQLPAPLPWLQFIPRTGMYGVDLFFFISGFVIVYPFIRAQQRNESEPAWTHFAWRRFIKIVPSYALSIPVAYAIGYAAFERTHSSVLQELLTHALFIHTWWAGTAGSINGVLWTLAIEVQFYALFPLVWWCFKRSPWATGLSLIAMAIAARTWGGHYAAPGVAAVLAKNLPCYIDLFAFGMLTAWCFVHFGQRLRHARARSLMPVLAGAGAVLLTLVLIDFSRGHAWGNVLMLQRREVLGISFALLAFGALCSPRGWAVPLSNPVLRFFAIISYNLYLWNAMIAHQTATLHLSQQWYTLTAVAVSIAIATLLTYGFERPLLRLRGASSSLASTRASRALASPIS